MHACFMIRLVFILHVCVFKKVRNYIIWTWFVHINTWSHVVAQVKENKLCFRWPWAQFHVCMSILPFVLGILKKGYVKPRRGSARVHKSYASCVDVKNSLSSKFLEKWKKCTHTSFEVFVISEGIMLMEWQKRPRPMKTTS